MCGRYAITMPPEAVREWFRTHGEIPNWPVYYNAAPTTALPVVLQGKEGERKLALVRWGLVPWGCNDGKHSYSTINARAESVRSSAFYRDRFENRRCIVPASGYFEWTGPKTDRQPHYFTRADGTPMALAGLWDRWRGADTSEAKETFTVITTEPSKFVAQFHNRMPLILEPDTWDAWLSGDPETAAALMKSANERVLNSRSVNKAVGNVKNNGPELLTEIPK
jgi:putative SOS response-associated peptidase YedK